LVHPPIPVSDMVYIDPAHQEELDSATSFSHHAIVQPQDSLRSYSLAEGYLMVVREDHRKVGVEAGIVVAVEERRVRTVVEKEVVDLRLCRRNRGLLGSRVRRRRLNFVGRWVGRRWRRRALEGRRRCFVGGGRFVVDHIDWEEESWFGVVWVLY